MLALIMLVGCNKNTNYATEEPFVIASSANAGPPIIWDIFPAYIAIYDNGKLLKYTKQTRRLFNVDDDAPVFETTIEEDEIKMIKKLIRKSKFWTLEEDLSLPHSLDGGYYYVTVNLTNQSKKVGGKNPDDENFLKLNDYIFDLVSPDDNRKWVDEVVEYLLEIHPELEEFMY